MLFRKPSSGSLLKDEELIRLYQQTKDSNYVGELYRRYTHLVYGVCLKYLKDPEESKDAVMHIFEQLLGVLKKQEVTHFYNWLHVLTRNHCLMKLRADKTKEEKVKALSRNGFLAEAGSDDEIPALILDAKIETLEKGLSQIPPEQRQCVELFYLHKKSYKEIAELTGYDLSKIKSYIQNGKRNLKIYIDRHHD
ncbi:RNA polymerase sigma factor [Adhaeribacter radiodurans]|uniref:Sigma-70 family RNA polymerase sigma factor n=1 Tax=Adhaeribacter radiodurans TaxID=2745197 RepID=A0A7L7L9R3_9BACT|nr:sigma-70 family RNA polymerase sigma factor [Adhaeribacter radiodurans]QMU29275.1 sigma-70 family RNA polymerase sigma factor [Adhaeribacter radiodurans]